MLGGGGGSGAPSCAAAGALALTWCLVLPEAAPGGVVSGAGWNADAASGHKELYADPNDVHTVHIVSQCHLDGGYKYPYVAQVASEWIQTWIPYSIALSEELRSAGGQVQHRWTMNPWFASLFLSCPEGEGAASWVEHNNWTRGRSDIESFRLRCPNATQVAAFKAAVARGDINFYASAFCTMYEYGDASLMSWVSNFTHSVGRVGGQKHVSTVASQRDEPGITRAAVPLLVDAGVTGYVQGVDWASPVAEVPRAFVWRDEPSGKELLMAWHNYGYGGGHSGRSGSWGHYTPQDPGSGNPPSDSGPDKCQSQPPAGQSCNSTITVPGFGHALALFVQDDNAGPPTRAQLEHYFQAVGNMFPKATTILSSTYEAFFDELDKIRHTLPVVTSEIADTWVDTPPSDPLLAAQFRALMRARRKCSQVATSSLCNGSDVTSAFYNFSRFLIKNIEHDWGPSGGFPSTGGGAGKDCGAVKQFTGFAGGPARYWRWSITQSHDGTGMHDAPTIHWLQLGNATAFHDMSGWKLTGPEFSNGPIENLLKVNGSGFWNSAGSAAPWNVTIDTGDASGIAVSRFQYSIYVAQEAPASFQLESASGHAGPWTLAFHTSNAGNDGCPSKPGLSHGVWTNAELQEAMSSCRGNYSDNAGCQDVVGWLDQRAWGTTMALKALNQTTPPHPLLVTAQVELAKLQAKRPVPSASSSLKPVGSADWAKPVTMIGGSATVSFSDAGAITKLHTSHRGLDYADAEHLLAETVVHVSSPGQRKAWSDAYMTDVNAGGEFFKLGDSYGDGRGYRPTVTAMWASNESVLFKQSLPDHVVADYGGARELWQRYEFAQDSVTAPVHVNITTMAFEKTPTRITESWWLRFHPKENAELKHSSMRLSKLGALIDPLDVVFNGSKTLHGLDEGGVVYGGSHAEGVFRVASLDVPIVKVGAGNASLDPSAPPLEGLNPAPVPNDRAPLLSGGLGFNIYNNLWNTNGIQWYPYVDRDKDWQFRFSMVVP